MSVCVTYGRFESDIHKSHSFPLCRSFISLIELASSVRIIFSSSLFVFVLLFAKHFSSKNEDLIKQVGYTHAANLPSAVEL